MKLLLKIGLVSCCTKQLYNTMVRSNRAIPLNKCIFFNKQTRLSTFKTTVKECCIRKKQSNKAKQISKVTAYFFNKENNANQQSEATVQPICTEQTERSKKTKKTSEAMLRRMSLAGGA